MRGRTAASHRQADLKMESTRDCRVRPLPRLSRTGAARLHGHCTLVYSSTLRPRNERTPSSFIRFISRIIALRSTDR